MQPDAVETDSGGGTEPFEVFEGGADGDVVGLEEAVVAGEPPQTDSDFGAEKVASNPATAGISRPLPSCGRRGMSRAASSHGVVSQQQRFKVVGRHVAGQAQAVGLPAEPVARGFARPR